jgi:hypothetical protein
VLVAVSKTKPAEAIQACHEAGHIHFGENYVNELVTKAATVSSDYNRQSVNLSINQSINGTVLMIQSIGPTASHCDPMALHWTSAIQQMQATRLYVSTDPPPHAVTCCDVTQM